MTVFCLNVLVFVLFFKHIYITTYQFEGVNVRLEVCKLRTVVMRAMML